MSRTILVADDSPTIRKIVELTFTDTDIRVEVADSGSAALDRIGALQPDLVLADVFMPEPTGYDLCRTIKSSERPVPVVLLAGTFEPFDSEMARDCGADAHLVKPFESEVLLEKVRTLLEPPAEPEAPEEPETEEDSGAQFVDQVLAVVSDDDDSTSAAGPGHQPVQAATRSEPARTMSLPITQDFVDAVADAVVQRISSEVVREIANDVVPRLATEIIRERIRELEQQELDEERAES
jgi:CheY-like chemotaxis protein